MSESKSILLRSRKRKAEELLRARRLPEARAAYAQLCHQEPRNHETWLNLGAINGMLGLFDDAENAFKRAATLHSREPRTHLNLARLYGLLERPEEAILHWQSYLRLKPNDPEGLAQFGMLLHKSGRLTEAEQALRAALSHAANNPHLHNNLGVILQDQHRYDEALASYRAALALRPQMDEAYCNLGNLHHLLGADEEAERCYRTALELNPDSAGTQMSLGHHYARRGHHDEAERCFREALRLNPDYASAHWNLALLLLARAEFSEGWQEYEWRFSAPEIKRPYMSLRYSSKPLWDGAPLNDPLNAQSLLVYAEQGFGDTLQFCRYLPLVRQRVKQVIFECQPELLTLLGDSLGGITLIPRPTDNTPPLQEYDQQIPLLSLPRIFKTALESVPRTLPYLYPNPERSAQWRQRLAGDEFRIGLVWAGNPGHQLDRLRSMALADLAPLGTVAGVCFYSLQKGPAAAEAASPPSGMRLIDLSPELDEFATTAAIIANLDLVISVDTAVTHLAGALGMPVWSLIYSPPDWRWLLEGTETPWYPTMRLFRQAQSGSWGETIERVRQALEKHIAQPRD